MSDYDFSQLSPHDFELICRDLLQAEWGLVLESFKAGKDGGIDFRYTQAGKQIIVQCKRFVETGFEPPRVYRRVFGSIVRLFFYHRSGLYRRSPLLRVRRNEKLAPCRNEELSPLRFRKGKP